MVDDTRNGGEPPVRVFVGTSAGGEDAEACLVLEHSLRSRASVPVEVEWVALSRDRRSPYYSDPRAGAGWRTEDWSTPWTALRWAVPEVAGWRGRAVYLDCAQVVLGDVAELAASDLPEGAIALLRRDAREVRVGCVVFDCAAARGRLPVLADLRADPGAHRSVGAAIAGDRSLAGDLPAGWGLRDADFSRDPAAATGSVHLASPSTQPHVALARRRLRAAGRDHWFRGTRLPHFSPGLVDLFRAEYAAALEAGYAVENYVPDVPWGDYAIGAGAVLGSARRRA